jgi:purine-binding chemotaxis protein CheW
MSASHTVQGLETYVLFMVAGTTYALPSSDVHHMEMLEGVTRVPNAPPFVEGVVFSRGQVVPVVNLRARFGFERVPYDLRTRLIVVQSADRVIGLVVDSAREFVNIPAGAIQPPHEALAGMSGRYVDGVASVGDRLILMLDLSRILTFAEDLSIDLTSRSLEKERYGNAQE